MLLGDPFNSICFKLFLQWSSNCAELLGDKIFPSPSQSHLKNVNK